jgi:hypothetical protein
MSTVQTPEVEEKVGPVLRDYMNLLQAHYNVMDLPGVKFASKISDNIDALETACEPLNEILEPTEAFKKFSQIVRDTANGDNAVIQEMEEANPVLINERKEQIAAGEEMMNQPFSVTLRTVREGELPNEINTRQLRDLKMVTKP